MKVVVIGAGFAGAACAWFASRAGAQVEIWDPKGPGGGASGAAAGLLHLYGGIRSKRVEGSVEALAVTEELLSVAGDGVVIGRGLFRKWMGPRQEKAFRQLAKRYDDVDLRDDGVWIPGAYAVDCPLYCQRLCERSGATLIHREVTDLSFDADHIFVCAGMGSLSFAKLPLEGVKGQLVRLAWPSDTVPLSHAIGGRGYLVMAPGGDSLYAGATFEHEYSDALPSPEAHAQILDRTAHLYPGLSEYPLLETVAGVRACTPHHKPLSIRLRENVSILTGLGSKGLLWHGLLAKQLVVESLRDCNIPSALL